MELGVRGWSWMKVGARFNNTQSLHYQRQNQDKLKPKFQNIIYKHLHYNQQNLSETKSNLKTSFYMTPFRKSVKEDNSN